MIKETHDGGTCQSPPHRLHFELGTAMYKLALQEEMKEAMAKVSLNKTDLLSLSWGTHCLLNI